MPITIDIHALHTLPPSLINRDDTGAPKSAIFGGVPRQRVSSQSWKRAIRKDFEEHWDASQVGYRTKRVVAKIVAAIQERAGKEEWPEERAAAAVEAVFKTLKIKLTEPKADPEEADPEERRRLAETGYLLFVSPRQVENIAEAIIAAEAEGTKIRKGKAQALFNQEHSVDIAMFGRMVADDAHYNVDASVQVAHALGIHASEPEFDFFTAVDDLVEDDQETGAGMMGTVQMMSSTLYRFATIDLDSLAENLGDREAAVIGAVQFLTSFVEALPTGKQNTFAHNTLPELVYVTVRDTRSVSLVNAFENPVQVGVANPTGRREEGAARLAAEAQQIEEVYGFKPLAAFVTGLGTLPEAFEAIAQKVSLPELGDSLRAALNAEGA
ncbi:type I-E CRISPR-associated protein Cas7/Cse4/CasC [Corynebacterium sp. zg-331]|uniref:type I-E CRISPR-associated protein Cas7/Cse4/CasC n=1 Tax=unclassified Corynebacterium TaxID=2624378 RepID=UPI00128B2667|nr:MULTISPECIES: type I-E CRISPR-associated protein Cas7/Cse4/CasC [unclassified Corynebacterium]MBC3186608.1 type I-E CRISPR-associated protein Cas7/Cse4/CasC [Corynebacterium sp. zg-331]MPV53092.1 type I-E CRISPR-associated protein Cas7/Cse4/CasC [Corynebacterium sp. zg331]